MRSHILEMSSPALGVARNRPDDSLNKAGDACLRVVLRALPPAFSQICGIDWTSAHGWYRVLLLLNGDHLNFLLCWDDHSRRMLVEACDREHAGLKAMGHEVRWNHRQFEISYSENMTGGGAMRALATCRTFYVSFWLHLMADRLSPDSSLLGTASGSALGQLSACSCPVCHDSKVVLLEVEAT